MKTLVLLDLDRTAFDTDHHFADFCRLIEAHFEIDSSQLKEREHRLTDKPSPYSPLDDIRYNESINVDPREVLQYVDSELRLFANSYLFDDVIPFLNWHKDKGNPIVLITVGTHEYQTHKKNLVPEFTNLPMVITRESKARVLHESLRFIENDGIMFSNDDINVEADNVVLIDDRAGTFKDVMPMPQDKRLKLVRIVREGISHSESQTPEGVDEIKLLTDLT